MVDAALNLKNLKRIKSSRTSYHYTDNEGNYFKTELLQSISFSSELDLIRVKKIIKDIEKKFGQDSTIVIRDNKYYICYYDRDKTWESKSWKMKSLLGKKGMKFYELTPIGIFHKMFVLK